MIYLTCGRPAPHACRWGPLGWAGAALIIASSLVMQLYGQEQGEPVLESGSESEKED